MYIHDYWNNPKKYDVYGDDFIFDLPGTVWELNTGKWLSGPTSQTYLEQTGVPLTREEIGSQRYIDFINSFLTQDEIDNNRWRYKFCVPVSYSTHEDLHPELRIDVDGPDWSVGSARPIRFNNPLNGTDFEIHGWEGEEGPNNGVNINTWNTGLAHAFPISERHIITTKHFFHDKMVVTNSGWIQFGPKSWYFLNKDNELYKKTFKFVAIDWSDDDYNNFLKTRTAGDALLLELQDNEDGFSSIGIDPSENYAKLNVRGQIADVEPFFSDSVNKAIATYQLDPQGRGNICHTPILSASNPDSDWGVMLSEEASHYMLSGYAKIFEGDSGTLAWCYSPTHGHIFLGGNNGGNETALGEPSARRASFASFEHLIKTGIRLFPLTSAGGPQVDETHPIPMTPIPNYELPFEFIETPNDLKQEVVRYDLPTEITTKICEVDFKANVSDAFDNTVETNSITSKTPIENFYDHSEITDDPNQQFPLPHTVQIAVNGNSAYPEELKESTFENEIFDRIYMDFQYGLKALAPEEVQTVPLHYITCEMEYKVPGTEDWIRDPNFAGLKPYVRHPVIRGSFKSSIFGILTSPDQVEGTEFRVRTKFVSEDFEFETTVPVGTVQDYRRSDNFRLEFDPREVYPGNEFVATLAWDEPEGGSNPVPRLSGEIPFYEIIGPDLIEYESIDDTTMKVIVSDAANPGDMTIGTLSTGFMYGPHDDVTVGVFYNIIGAPTVSFTEDSTSQDAAVTVGDEIILEANLTDYVGGTITAAINIDGVPVESQIITDATALDGDVYRLSYTVTQDNVDQNVDWSYSISVSNLAGDSPVQTRSGVINQIPRIIIGPNNTSDGILGIASTIIIDADLVNMDANGTTTAEIKIGDTVVTSTTLTGNETSLDLEYTITEADAPADTTWESQISITNNFGTATESFSGTVDIIEIEPPTITIDNTTSTSGTIVPGDTIILQATLENHDPVNGTGVITSSIIVDGVDTGATGVLTGDVYRIEYESDDTTADGTNWSSSITVENSSGSATDGRSGDFAVTVQPPIITVNNSASTSGVILPGDTITLEATLQNYNPTDGSGVITSSIVVGGVDTGATGVLVGDVYTITHTTDSAISLTTAWASNITVTNSAGTDSETINGSVFVEATEGPRSGPFPTEVGFNGGVVPTDRLEPWDNLRQELELIPENGDIDLGGRGFYMTVDDRNAITPEKNITIRNGIFIGGPKLDWSPLNDGSGLWVADLPEEGRPGNAFRDRTLHSVLSQLTVPRLQKNIPFQACWPTNNFWDTWPWDIGFWTETSGGFWLSGAGGEGGNPAAKPESYADSNDIEDWRAINVSSNVADVLTEINNGISGYDSPDPLLDYNLWGGEIRGLRIVDTRIIDELNSIFDGKDASNFHIIINSDANLSKDFPITEWDPDTNFLGIDGRGFNWNGYMHFVITGSKDFIANRSNRYAVEFDGDNTGKIYYLPADETSWMDEDGNAEGFYPVMDRAFNNAEGTIFDNCTFHSFGQYGTTPGAIRPRSVNSVDNHVTLNNCLFFGCAVAGFQGRFHSTSTYFYYMTFRGFSGIAHGSRFINNNFYGMPRNSALFFSGTYGLFEDTNGDGSWTGEDDPPGLPTDEKVFPNSMQETYCEGNYFDVTFSNHGQGISTYVNSWNNSIIKNNIFYNCGNAMSHQPQDTVGPEANPFTAKCIFENNLIVYTNNFGKGFGGQSTWAFNGASDEFMPPEPLNLSHQNDQNLAQDNQQVRYWNNTCLLNFNHPSWSDGILPPRDAQELFTGYYVQRSKLRNSDTVFSNNLIMGSGPSSETHVNGGHVQFNNLYVTDDSNQPQGPASGYGSYDNADTPLSEVYNFETNEVIGNALTSGSDGGRVGVRWASYPPDEVLKNIPINWADIYVGDEDIDRIGGETEAEFQSFLQQHEIEGGVDPYVQGTQDRRPYGDPVLVQRFTVSRKADDSGNEAAIHTLRDEDVFTPHSSFLGRDATNVVSHIFLNHGDQAQSEPGGQSNNSFNTQENRENFYKKYEIRFRWKDDTVENGSVENPIPLQIYPAQHCMINGYNSSNSRMLKYDGGPGSSKAPLMGVEEGIWKWEPGCEVEFFIYRLDPIQRFNEEDGGVNPREWSEFDETDTTEFPVQGGISEDHRLYVRPVAFFETPSINNYTGSITARVIVHPYNGVKDDGTPNGINRVDFYLNGGGVTSVSTPVTYTTDAGFEEVAYEVTYNGSLSHELNEIRAVVWPNVGRVRILQGTGYFSNDGIDIYGNRVNDNTLEPLTWGPGYNMRERGCLLQVTPATYHISPSGSDVDGNGSRETPYETPQEVYRRHGTSCIIDNSAYNDNSIALNASDFLLVRDVRDFGYGVRSDFDGRIPLPIIKGGVMIGVPNTTGGTNPMTLGSPTQDEEIVQGFMFQDGDIRTPAFPADPGESIECHFYNISGGQGTRRANTLHIVLNNCDIGPSDNAMQELMQQRTVGSSTTGVRFDWRGTGGRSPVSLYKCVTRYSHFTNVFEVFHCKSIGIGMLDPYNSEKMFDVHIKSANSWTWPWGPVGEPIICNKGDFDDFVPQTEEGGIATNTETLSALHAFYELLGAPETAQGSPVPNSTYIDVDGDNWILKSEANVNSADWNTLKSLWDAIPFTENQIFPVAITQLKYEGASPFKARTDIDISAIDPDLFAILGDRKTAKDPHVDIQQSYWDGQYRENPDTEELKDKTWLSNTVASSVKIEGNANRYQGIFHSDGSAVLESAFWNFEFDKIALSDSYLLSLDSGHSGQEYGHRGVHVGPNILMKDPERAFRVRSGSFYSGLGNATFYDEDSNRFAAGIGSLTDMTGWPEYPQENLVEMIQENGTSHWYYTDVPTPFTLLSSVTFVQEPGANNSTVTEAFNSDRIGTFQPYNQEYTWTVGDVYIDNITTGQLRFGPAVTWDAGNGADTYGAITSGNSNTAPAEWVNTFLRNEHVLRITITIAGNEKVYVFNQDDGEVFNPQNGYIIIQQNKFDDWDFAGGMTIKMELLST